MANTRDVIGDQATLDGLVSNTLTSLEEDKVTKIRGSVFRENSALTSINLPNLTEVPGYAFSATGITEIVLPSVHIVRTDGIPYCNSLTTIDLASSSVTTIEAKAFESCPNLTHLIIRSETVPTLGNTNALSGSRIDQGHGYIYVPVNLVSSYKTASNWSSFALNICPISDYPRNPYNDTITDSWTEIIAACANGTYATKYAIGDVKTLDFGTEGVHGMQIVAFDMDDLAGGTGKAHITWICKDILPTTYRINSNRSTSGGYGSSAIRTYLSDTILPKLPAEVQAAILEVSKVQGTYENNAVVQNGQTTTEKLWIPSQYELNGGSSYESTGARYYVVFSSGARRTKYMNGSATAWWLRSVNNGGQFRRAGTEGNIQYDNADAYHGVVPGFCI